ncbi:hypothetical protein EN871_24435 [bacterium M00.F.Ca.ET.228.01.1.1]|uniref:hypothetical protein n=1 Tax=Burkholderiaceae TaxID=119060 RepID=UPI0004895FBC|nr:MULTISPECIES: hypothetical protein [Burkholderiaceae]TGP41198.1 hypothetical protein EN871_24435 [bacterium M00.F.Ca.ET.228.01.1.1]TGR97744.1 hypothetical protein EN834_24050 [bacterium M00.F.Ca.ET.191.01.1.1]TGU01911.1 hypothetical protein EN798_24870 [bacterium M00.F.Ca.ET.155.01.1.1]MBW0451057.1 hypothetical protein [Paraburkholderia phenoliruptrix]MBW9101912.1 hypothetical protein [Paraburkholderia phenoliruptrix]
MDDKRRLIFWRFAKGYLSLIAMIVFVLGVSLAKGAGWKPMLAGMPVYITFFVGITYQFVKELRALNREKPRDPE